MKCEHPRVRRYGARRTGVPWAKLVHYEQSEAYRSCRRWYGRSCQSSARRGAVIRELEPDADIAVVGTVVGLEHDLVPQAGFELETIEKVPFPRRPNMAALKFPAQWKAETAKVRDILTRHEAQVVVGFGGYTSAPVYAAAHKMGIPIAMHEQNARAGMANKLGARWASMIGTAYAPNRLEATQGC